MIDCKTVRALEEAAAIEEIIEVLASLAEHQTRHTRTSDKLFKIRFGCGTY